MNEPKAKYEPHRQEGDPTIIPPAHHIGLAGHHWVQYVDFDGRPCGSKVLQWQPVARRWCLPDDYARGNDFNVTSYEYVAPCPMPLFPDDLERLQRIVRSADDMAKGSAGVVSFNQDTWNFIRGVLYPKLP